MAKVEFQQVQAQFLELIERAASGEEVIICKDGRPLVKLSAVDRQKKQRRFGSARGLIKMMPDFDEPLEDFEE